MCWEPNPTSQRSRTVARIALLAALVGSVWLLGERLSLSADAEHDPAGTPTRTTKPPPKPPTLPSLTPASSEGERVYYRVLPATCWLLAGKMTGTGTVLDKANRLVITNCHVVGDATSVEAMFPVVRDGRVVAEKSHYLRSVVRIKGRVIHRDEKRDLAIVRLEELPAGTPELPLARESVRPGATLHSVGNPAVSGALWVYTAGTVRQVYRRQFRLNDGRKLDTTVVESQSPINSGDSGGPVVDDDGQLVAVVQSFETRDARLVSTFIDVSEVRAVLEAARRSPVLTGPEKPSDPPSLHADQPASKSGITARLLSMRQEHNILRDGKHGLAVHLEFEIHGGQGKTGEVVVVFHDAKKQPIKAPRRECANAAGELCTFARLAPGFERTAYKDLVLFMPYENLITAGSGRVEILFTVNVWMQGAWVAENPLWAAFEINRGK